MILDRRQLIGRGSECPRCPLWCSPRTNLADRLTNPADIIPEPGRKSIGSLAQADLDADAESGPTAS
jgi:hypothetical protein